MSRYATNFAAALAAVFLVVATWTPVITVPADPVILGAPTIA